MNVTDKMLDAARNAYDTFSVHCFCERDAMRKAIEVAIQLKWVEFDPNDETTWPPLDSGGMRSIRVVTNSGDICEFIHTNKQWIYLLSYGINPVTHWARLPVYKEVKKWQP